MNNKPNKADSDKGLVFNIQKFSLHDGSGIRTLIFLKGCPLSCTWCSNPEGQSYSPELAYNDGKCIGTKECIMCMEACRQGAVDERDDGKVEIDRALCDNCGECVEACPSKALELFGRLMSVEEVISVVEEDSGFYARSDGGLTLSGGEALSQIGFVVRLLKTARGRGIDTALETSGLCNWDDLESACRHVNHVFYDIKSMDAAKHKASTGIDNTVILENFRRLCETFPGLSITVRTPVIPGFNDSPDEIEAIADYVHSMPGSQKYELLAYHRFGGPKYQQLGKEYVLQDLELPTEERMVILNEIARLEGTPLEN